MLKEFASLNTRREHTQAQTNENAFNIDGKLILLRKQNTVWGYAISQQKLFLHPEIKE